MATGRRGTPAEVIAGERACVASIGETRNDPADLVALLKAAIDRSGLSNSAYARQVLVRDPRQLRRWLAGQPIPDAVGRFLEREARAGAPPG